MSVSSLFSKAVQTIKDLGKGDPWSVHFDIPHQGAINELHAFDRLHVVQARNGGFNIALSHVGMAASATSFAPVTHSFFCYNEKHDSNLLTGATKQQVVEFLDEKLSSLGVCHAGRRKFENWKKEVTPHIASAGPAAPAM